MAPASSAFFKNRNFSSARKALDVAAPPPVDESGGAAVEESSKDAKLAGDAPQREESALPWYLQDQDQEPTRPILQSQDLPEIPSDAPEKLRPILERLSIEIGLDHLALIDLRHIEPPPALGSNLMMVIGTARSEKHLHVSADRFCRWLRTGYKLRPYADGLLGRNELKLKLRRKARRTKLMGGTSKPSEEDDGIRSDWICVNVGPIEESKGTEQSLEQEGIIGFGGREDGTRLVVQMLTENKRADVDLESLWNGFVRRQGRRDERDAAKIAELAAEFARIEVGHGASQSVPVADSAFGAPYSHRTRPTLSVSQTRGFHSSPLHCDSGPAMAAAPSGYPILAPLKINEEPAALDSSTAHTPDAYGAPFAHISYLEELSRSEAIAALGQDSRDRESTTYLKEVYSMIPVFHEQRHWIVRFQMFQIAIDLEHPGYTIDGFLDLLHEAQTSSAPLTPTTYRRIIQTIADNADKADAQLEDADTMKPLLAIISLLEDMDVMGMDITNRETLEAVFKAYEYARSADTDPANARLRVDSATCLARLFNRNRLPVPSLSLPIMVLDEYSSAQRWDIYWRYWRHLPSNLPRRPQILYTAMFFQLARNQHQRMCFDALTEWIPMLKLEWPVVQITADLAAAIMECLKVADPDVEQQALDNENEKGQWVKLWRICERGLEKDAEDTDTLQAQAEERYPMGQYER